MKKVLCIFLLNLFIIPTFARELTIQRIDPANKPQGTIEISSDRLYSEVQQGDSQSVVFEKMGKPTMVGQNPDGTQTWEYEQLSKTKSSSFGPGVSPSLASGAAAFNASIASNGFGRNMYTGEEITPYIPSEQEHETISIRIKFNSQGRVEYIKSNKNKY